MLKRVVYVMALASSGERVVGYGKWLVDGSVLKLIHLPVHVHAGLLQWAWLSEANAAGTQ